MYKQNLRIASFILIFAVGFVVSVPALLSSVNKTGMKRNPSLVPQDSTTYGIIYNLPPFGGGTNQVKDVYVDGNIAYIAEGSGLVCENVSDPANPEFLSNYTTDSSGIGINKINNTVLFAASTAGLYSFNVTNASNPVCLCKEYYYGSAQQVFVKQNETSIAYLSVSDGGLETMNISNMSNIQYINGRLVGTYIYGSYVIGDIAYLANAGNGLSIFNVSNPASITTISSGYLTGGNALGIEVVNKIAYVASYLGGVDIVNVSNPSAPQNITSINISPYYANNLAISRNLLFVSTMTSGNNSALLEYDISNPIQPVSIQNYTFPGNAAKVFVTNGLAYVADDEGGLYIIRYQPVNQIIPLETPTLQSISPNPSITGNITLQWNAVQYADNYIVFRSSQPITTINSSVITLGATSGSTWQDSITNSGTYYYAVQAVNATTSSNISTSQSVIVNLPTVLETPVLQPITPNPSTNGNITLQWNAVQYVDNYSIFRSNQSFSSVSGSVITLGTTSGLTWQDSITESSTYYYAVQANNETTNSLLSACQSVVVNITSTPPTPSGNGTNSNETNSTAPKAPQDLKATPENGLITLSWQAPSNNGGSAITGYKIYRGNSSGKESYITTVGNVLNYNDSGLSPNTTYYYAVSAINSAGESPKSSEANATTLSQENNTNNTNNSNNKIDGITIVELLYTGLMGVVISTVITKKRLK